jgi:hypothetical protein
MAGRTIKICVIHSNWLRILRSCLAVAALVAISLVAAVSTADASSVRVTQGDAQSILDAFGNGGWAVRLSSGQGVQANGPADLEIRAAIRPLAFYNGRHYCIDDWHVLLLAIFDGGDTSYTYQYAATVLDPITLDLKLDGNSLTTTRTSIKRFLNPEQFGYEEAYYWQQGTLMPPGALSVGAHQLSSKLSGGAHGSSSAKFYVDPSGTGACL